MNINHLVEELLRLHADSFSPVFKNNKDAISKLIILSPHLRNQIAGRIARVNKRKEQ